MTAPRFLIIEARFYEELADELVAGATAVLDAAGAAYDRISVPGVLETPAALALAVDTGTYDGYVMLGCVIRGETSHYDLICNEVARALMDLSLSGIPVGFGVLTVEDEKQAKVRADRKKKNKGAEAAAAVLRMVGLSYRFREGVEE